MKKDEWRKKLDNRLTPIHLYKITPKTNCGDCGFATCLAFATQVIVGQGDLDSCPHIDKELLGPFRNQLADQHEAGIGVKREGFEKTMGYLRGRLKQSNFKLIAPTIGAAYVERDGEPTLEIIYFGEAVLATKEDIVAVSGKELDPWEKIFLYNYVIGGATEPSGAWVGMESLPNSVSKIKSLKAHCEDRLAEAYAGKMEQLSRSIDGLGQKVSSEIEHVDFAAEFQILPKLAVRVFWWDEEPEEGFPCRVKFLFDSRVLEMLDLESLIFSCEQLTDRLLHRS